MTKFGATNRFAIDHSGPPPYEQDVDEPRRLVMEYNVRCRYEVAILPGHGAVSRAMYEAVSTVAGQANVDPASVRFRLESA